MGLTYFKRFRMACDLRRHLQVAMPPGPDFLMVPYSSQWLRHHGNTKYESFVGEMDSMVFPCLARRDGCGRLMREITSRRCFVAEATWLCRHRDPTLGRTLDVGTVQGLEIDGAGSIQNLGVIPGYRGQNIGSALLHHAAIGFRARGLHSMHLEVTADNFGAVRLYQRLGFQTFQTVYKAAEVPDMAASR